MAAMIEGLRTVAGDDPNRYGDVATSDGGPGRRYADGANAYGPARFERALNRAWDRREGDDRSVSGPARALGEGLYDAADALDRDWTAVTRLAASLHAGRRGPADMMALQGRLLQVSLQMDLASKLVQKSTQAVDQLVRIQ